MSNNNKNLFDRTGKRKEEEDFKGITHVTRCTITGCTGKSIVEMGGKKDKNF